MYCHTTVYVTGGAHQDGHCSWYNREVISRPEELHWSRHSSLHPWLRRWPQSVFGTFPQPNCLPFCVRVAFLNPPKYRSRGNKIELPSILSHCRYSWCDHRSYDEDSASSWGEEIRLGCVCFVWTRSWVCTRSSQASESMKKHQMILDNHVIVTIAMCTSLN